MSFLRQCLNDVRGRVERRDGPVVVFAQELPLVEAHVESAILHGGGTVLPAPPNARSIRFPRYQSPRHQEARPR
jgi:hypothetical protein